MKCKCREINQLEGNEAIEYADKHLIVVSIDNINWETELICTYTKIKWVLDYPKSYLQGGGPPRLRKIIGEINE